MTGLRSFLSSLNLLPILAVAAILVALVIYFVDRSRYDLAVLLMLAGIVLAVLTEKGSP